MVELYGHQENIKGCRPSVRYQRYFNRVNKLYFENSLPQVIVYVAPLLKITQLSQKAALEKDNRKHAGMYAITGYDQDNNPCIILDKGTAIFHSIITKQSVLHECIHWHIGMDKPHGKEFYADVRRIAALGALDKLI